MVCEHFDRLAVTIELHFSTIASALSLFGAVALLSLIRKTERSAKTELIKWVALTDLAWSSCWMVMLASLIYERAPDRCIYESWKLWQHALVGAGSVCSGASMGYTSLVGYQLLQILKSINRAFENSDYSTECKKMGYQSLPKNSVDDGRVSAFALSNTVDLIWSETNDWERDFYVPSKFSRLWWGNHIACWSLGAVVCWSPGPVL